MNSLYYLCNFFFENKVYFKICSPYSDKELTCQCGEVRHVSVIPRRGRSPGGGYSNPLQYSCLENPIDRGAWQVTVLRVAKSWTQLNPLSMHSPIQRQRTKFYPAMWKKSK